MPITKRFVAGAVCPRCGEMDRLRVWRDDVREYRECVNCDYEDAMRLDGASEPEELATRVNQEKDDPNLQTVDGIEVVKLVDSPRRDH